MRTGPYEFYTMCSYDAAAGLEYLIAHADELSIDVHRIGFMGGSAGGGEMNYLSYVYHALHASRYTPLSMVYPEAQLDYPVRAWVAAADGTDGGGLSLWAGAVGADTPLHKVMEKSACEAIVGS